LEEKSGGNQEGKLEKIRKKNQEEKSGRKIKRKSKRKIRRKNWMGIMV